MNKSQSGGIGFLGTAFVWWLLEEVFTTFKSLIISHIPNWLILDPIVIGLAFVGGIFLLWNKFNKEVSHSEDEREHRKELLNLLNRRASSAGISWGNGYPQPCDFFWNDSIRKQSQLLNHLKEYKDVYGSYKDAKAFSNSKYREIETKLQSCHEYIKNRMSSFRSLRVTPDQSIPSEPAFMLDRFVGYFLWKMHQETKGGNAERGCKIQDRRLEYGRGDIAYGDPSSLRELQAMIESLQTDITIKSMIKEIIDMEETLEDDELIRTFNDKREKLFSEQEFKPLKGKCNGCPDSI